MGAARAEPPPVPHDANPTPDVLREKVFGPLLVADASHVSDEALSIQIASQGLPGAEKSWRTLASSDAAYYQDRQHTNTEVYSHEGLQA